MRPLVVEATLRTAVALPDPLHLDSLLEQVVAMRVGSEVTRATPEAELRYFDLPIATIEALGHAVRVCSAAMPVEPHAPDIMVQVKRRDVEDWDRLDKPVNVAAGPNKDAMVRTQVLLARTLRWRAIGHRPGVVDLLRKLWGPQDDPWGATGSIRRAGLGSLERWRVYEADHRAEQCVVDGRRALRHLPAAWVREAKWWRRGAWRGPYWHPARQVRVPRVGTDVDLYPDAWAALRRLDVD